MLSLSKQITVDVSKTLGVESLTAIAINSKYAFVNGERTNDLEGYNVKVVCRKLGYEQINVFLKEKPNFDIEEPIEVTFTNLELQVYVYNGRLSLKGIADSVKPLNSNDKK